MIINSKTKNNMKKTYLIPAFKVEEAEVVNMLAESLVIDGETTVDGGDALTKEDSWEIWSDEEEE